MSDRVLITGANGGIGSALAKEFAMHRHNLILTARRKESLDNIVAACRTLGVSVDVIIVDLAESNGPQKVLDAVTKLGHPVKYLVNNAGFATYGDFAAVPAKESDNLIAVNISAVTKLTNLFLPQISKQKGGILNVASTAAFLPGPLMATYYASKAYVLNFSLGIREELAGTVHVSVLCPGPTKTGFQHRADMERSKLMQGNLMDARTVAKAAYKGFMHNKAIITPGTSNKLTTVLPRLIPKPITAKFVKRAQSEN